MIQSSLKSCIFLLLGLIAMFLFMKNCTGSNPTDQISISSPEKTVVVKLTTRTDTVWDKKYIFVHDTIEKPTLVRVTDTIFVDGGKQVAMMPQIKREYKDKVKLADSTFVSYTANTTGTLDKISLEYSDTRAEKTIIRTNNIETTTTITKKPKGLYIGIGSNLELNELSPSIQYVNDKNIYGIKYNVATQTQGIQNIGITYSRKLF